MLSLYQLGLGMPQSFFFLHFDQGLVSTIVSIYYKKKSCFDEERELFFSADRKICTENTVRLYTAIGK